MIFSPFLKSASSSVRRLAAREQALAITEYALLVALIALVVVGVVGIFGSQIGSWLSAKSAAITTI